MPRNSRAASSSVSHVRAAASGSPPVFRISTSGWNDGTACGPNSFTASVSTLSRSRNVDAGPPGPTGGCCSKFPSSFGKP